MENNDVFTAADFKKVSDFHTCLNCGRKFAYTVPYIFSGKSAKTTIHTVCGDKFRGFIFKMDKNFNLDSLRKEEK